MLQVSFAQAKVITGKIISSKDGVAIPNVSVFANGTQTGTQTDNEGNFILTLPETVNTLKISAVGFATQDVNIKGKASVDIALVAIYSSLDDVVVIGYGTAKKKDLTGSVGSVSAKNFNKGIYPSPDQLIQGKVAGVQITNNNGQPGDAATFRIRGNSALSGTGQPLYVIDGVPLDGRTLQAGVTQVLDGSAVQSGVNPLNFVNPEDIASIDVLKDASATAIYGSRAAYGVVMINTKKAQAGQTKLNASISAGVASVLKKIKVLNAAQFREAIKYYGLDSTLDGGGNTDALDALLQKATQQNYAIGITGGTETGKYRLSANLLNQDGIIRNTGFKKYAVDLSTNFKFLSSKKLGIDINAIGSQSIQNVPEPQYGAGTLVTSALTFNPTHSLINADGSPDLGTPGNPSLNAILNLLNNNFQTTTILASIAPSYKFTNWLEYKLLASINYNAGITRYSANKDYPGEQGMGTATINNSELTTSQVTNTLNFNKKIFGDLNLEALAGFEYMKFTMKGSYLSGKGVDTTGGFGNYGLDYTNYIQFSSQNSRRISTFIDPATELQSYFGRAILNYKDKYMLTGTFRADGSTKFGKNHKYGYFPSFAAAWNISKEKFFREGFVDQLKIRAGWGRTGNQEFPSGASQAKYSFRDNGVLIQVNSPNPDLKWQSDRQYNIGLDFSILNNRISGTMDYFNKSSTNLLFPGPPIQPAPPSSVVRWVNLDGQIINKGFEVQVNAGIIRGKKISWDIGANATFLKNSVANIPFPVYTGDVGGPVQIIQNGYPMQTFYTREFLGLDKSTGFSLYKDDGATYYYVGNPNPKTLLGISSTLSYNRLTLTANMFGAFGQDIYNGTQMIYLNIARIQGGGNVAVAEFNQSVKESFDNPLLPSSRYIMKGSYFKMANLTLAYNMGDVVKTFKGMNIYITGQNLFLFTKYPGFDPETNSLTGVNGNSNTNVPSLGIDYPHYPSARTFIVGINFSL
ncbi:MAG: SusC/RagA family TonB-linked outer membrane protein [Ferruginibacter sp.]